MHQSIENCYWVIPGELLAGEYSGDMNVAFVRAKIAHCSRLTSPPLLT
jgi:hypothetical protein